MIKEDISTYRAIILLILSSIFAIIGYAIINIEKINNKSNNNRNYCKFSFACRPVYNT